MAGNNNKGQWLQVDFGKVVKVTKIATQGRHNANQYITKYVVSSSLDGSLFQFQEHKPYTVPRVGCKSVRQISPYMHFEACSTLCGIELNTVFSKVIQKSVAQVFRPH